MKSEKKLASGLSYCPRRFNVSVAKKLISSCVQIVDFEDGKESLEYTRRRFKEFGLLLGFYCPYCPTIRAVNKGAIR